MFEMQFDQLRFMDPSEDSHYPGIWQSQVNSMKTAARSLNINTRPYYRKKKGFLHSTALRLAVAFTAAAAAFIIVLSSVNLTQAEEDTLARKQYTSICIQPGDSLWSIAEQYADGHYSSIQEYIDEVRFINELPSDTIHAYAYLVIPYYKG